MINYILTSGLIHAVIILSLCQSPIFNTSLTEVNFIENPKKIESPPILQAGIKPLKSLESGFRDQKHEKIDPKDYAEKLKSIVDPVWVSKIEPYQSNLSQNYEIIVLLSVDKYGRVSSIRIKKSSGDPNLDALAIQTFREIGALPIPPESVVKDGIEWSLLF